jgi:hypothetical protein
MLTRRKLVTWPLAVAFVVGLSPAAAACQADFADRFQGRWEADFEKTKKYLKDHEVDQEFPPDFLEAEPKFVLEIRPSGEAKVSMQKPPDREVETLQGTWKLVEEIDSSHAKVRLTMVVEGREDPREATIEFLDDETIAVLVQEEPAIVFVRSREEEDGESDE